MSIKDLAPELIHNIVGRLDNKDIGPVRLVCKQLNDVAAEYLLEEVTVFLTTASCDRLKEIAKCSHIAKGIRVLWIEPYRIARKDGDSILRSRPISIEGNTKGYPGRIWSDHGPWDIHRHAASYRDQQLVLISTLLLDCTRALFAASPKLRSIRVSINNRLRFSECMDVKSFRALEGDPRFFALPGAGHTKVDIEQPLLAAFHAGRAIKSLHVAPVHHSLFHTADQNVRSIFAGLEDIHLHVRNPVVGDFIKASRYGYFVQSIQRGKMVDMLKLASSLQSLSLDLPLVDLPLGVASPLPLLQFVTGDTVWPMLTFLHLRGIGCTATALKSLIDRHTRLKTLRLGEVSLVRGCWRDLLAGYAGNWGPVEDVRLRGKFFDVNREGQYGLAFRLVEGGEADHLQRWDHYIRHGGVVPAMLADEAN